MHGRMERIDELIRQEISRLLEADNEELGLISVIAVQTTKDLNVARVIVAPLLENGDTELAVKLAANAGKYRHALSKRLDLYRVPTIEFIIERDSKASNRVDELFAEIDAGSES